MNMIFLCQMRCIFDTHFYRISISFDACSMYVRFFEFFFNLKSMHFDLYFDDIPILLDRFFMDIRRIFDTLQSARLKCKLMVFDIFSIQFLCFPMEWLDLSKLYWVTIELHRNKIEKFLNSVSNVYRICIKTIELCIKMHDNHRINFWNASNYVKFFVNKIFILYICLSTKMYRILGTLIYVRYIIDSFSIMSYIRCLLDTYREIWQKWYFWTFFLQFLFVLL